jgi:ABC-type bacteriocin/lantibiotic exporter with double-glycine peptidase domain
VETAIMNTIFALPENMTTIIIAHRLSTVERCDTLYWIDKGELVAGGTPDKVLPRYQAVLGGNSSSNPPESPDAGTHDEIGNVSMP